MPPEPSHSTARCPARSRWTKRSSAAKKPTSTKTTTDEVKVLRCEARDLKEVVAEQALELRLLKKKHDRG